jgi:hypothetical protein
MAYRVLTNQEKEELKNYQDFKEECKWGILNKAAYWKGLDGASVPGNDRIKWAKCRQYAASLQYSPQSVNPDNNPQVVDRFLVYIKTILCVDDAQAFDAAAVVAYLLTNSHFEAMAETWFDDSIATTLF